MSQYSDNHHHNKRPVNVQTFDPKTQEIEVLDDEVKSNDEQEIRHDEPIIQVEDTNNGMQLANMEEIGY